MEFRMFKVAKLDGVPKGVWWPVRLEEKEEDSTKPKTKVSVFVKSDNALLDIDANKIKEFQLSYRNEGERILRKKRKFNTLDAYITDFDWVIHDSSQVQQPSDGSLNIDSSQVQQSGDGSLNIDSSQVQQTRDGSLNIDSSQVQQPGDGSLNIDSSQVQQSGDGSLNIDSSQVQQTRDGSLNIDSSQVQQPGDGSLNIDSSQVQQSGDGSLNINSSQVQQHRDGSLNIDSSQVQQPGDGSLNIDSSQVQQHCDGSLNIDSSQVQQPRDGSLNIDSSQVQQTRDGSLNIDSSPVQQPCDGSLNIDSSQVQQTRDGSLNIDSSQVQQPRDGSLNINSSQVQQSGDGSLNIDSSLVQQTRDGSLNIDSSLVQQPHDGSLNIDSSQVQQPHDGSLNIDSSEVQQSGDGSLMIHSSPVKQSDDGSLNIDSSQVQQPGDGSLNIDSSQVQQPHDGSLNIDSSPVQQSGDGSLNIDSSQVQQPHDGSLNIDSSLVQQPRDGSLNIDSSEVQQSGDGSLMIHSSPVKQSDDGSLNIDSSQVQQPGDGSLNIDSSQVQQPGDGSLNIDSSQVQQPGDGSLNIDSSQVQQPHDGSLNIDSSQVQQPGDGSLNIDSSQVQQPGDGSLNIDSSPVQQTCDGSMNIDSSQVQQTRDGSLNIDSSQVQLTRDGSLNIDSSQVLQTRDGSLNIDSSQVQQTRDGSLNINSLQVLQPHDGSLNKDSSQVQQPHDGSLNINSSQVHQTHDGSLNIDSSQVQQPGDGSLNIDSSPVQQTRDGSLNIDSSKVQQPHDGTLNNDNYQSKTCNIINHENNKIVIIPGSESEETTILVMDNMEWNSLDNFDINELDNVVLLEGQTDFSRSCDEKNFVDSSIQYTATPISNCEELTTKKCIPSNTNEMKENKCYKKRKYMAILSDSDSDDMLEQHGPQQNEQIVPLSCNSDSDMSTEYPMLNKIPHLKKKKETKKPALEDFDESEDENPSLCIANDSKHSGIYFSLVQKSEFSKLSGEMKKTNRVYDSKHPCPFCSKIVSNFSHHIFTQQHESEDSVKKIRNEEDEKLRKKLINLLRLKAANEHNIKVKEGKTGEIFLLRRSSLEDVSVDAEGKRTIDLDKYGPCPHCYGWILLKSIRRHYKSCSAISESSVHIPSKGELIIQSDILAGRISENASQMLKEEVFPIMQVDEISKVAKTDHLIIVLGNNWMMRNRGNRIMRKYYTSSIMRLAARHKIQCQQLTKQDGDVEYFLKPCFFDTVVQAALNCSNVSEIDEEDLKAPSNCIKLGYDIKRMASSKLASAIKNEDEKRRSEAREFMELMRLEWNLKVTRLARGILHEQSFNTEKKLPIPEDIKKLSEYLKKEIGDLDLDDVTYPNYRKIAILILAKLTLYNRRRCHEVQAMRLESYALRKKGMDEVAIELRGELTKFESRLLETSEMVIIRGKTGKGVPVILPSEVKDALSYIVNSTNRMKVGILQDNPFVFANNRAGVFRAYDAIREVTGNPAAGLKHPNLVRTSNMRKYMATMLQALNTSDTERQWIIDHLGHTMNVHRVHYRQTSDILERVDIAKVLLIQDFGLVGKYKGKTLQEIDLNDLVQNVNVNGNDGDDVQSDSVPEVEVEVGVNEDSDFVPAQSEFEDSDDEMDVPTKKPPRKSQHKRQKWTEEEEEEIKVLFVKNFNMKHCPGQKEIRKAIGKSLSNKGVIHRRSLENIKKKVSAMLIKKFGKNYAKKK